MTFVFIDTNVLLHYQFFDEVDWSTQLGVTDVTLVFAPVSRPAKLGSESKVVGVCDDGIA